VFRVDSFDRLLEKIGTESMSDEEIAAGGRADQTPRRARPAPGDRGGHDERHGAHARGAPRQAPAPYRADRGCRHRCDRRASRRRGHGRYDGHLRGVEAPAAVAWAGARAQRAFVGAPGVRARCALAPWGARPPAGDDRGLPVGRLRGARQPIRLREHPGHPVLPHARRTLRRRVERDRGDAHAAHGSVVPCPRHRGGPRAAHARCRLASLGMVGGGGHRTRPGVHRPDRGPAALGGPPDRRRAGAAVACGAARESSGRRTCSPTPW
jgi:hypothetical protein